MSTKPDRAPENGDLPHSRSQLHDRGNRPWRLSGHTGERSSDLTEDRHEFESWPTGDRSTRRQLIQLQRENDALVVKLARLGPAVRNLAKDLAASRRNLRASERQIRVLQAENASLRRVRPAADGNDTASRQSLAARVSSPSHAPAPRSQTVVDGERRQIERDLHDGAQQRLIALRFQLARAEDLVWANPERGVDHLRALGEEVEAILDEIRSLAQGIYPSLLANFGLAEALRAEVRRSSLVSSFTSDGVGRHPQEVESALYFTVREALQNVTKHAEARHVNVSLIENSDLRFVVTDDGAGFDVTAVAPRSGITNMRDRLAALGGRLQIDSTPGRGTIVSGRVPLHRQDCHRS